MVEEGLLFSGFDRRSHLVAASPGCCMWCVFR